MEGLKEIVGKFDITGKVADIKPLGEGFINDTLIVHTEGDAPDYILQRKNKSIFPDVPAMMDNIQRVTAHLRKKAADPDREVMTVVKAKDGLPYYQDADGEYWAMTVFIPDTIAYDNADSPALAYKGGKGIGHFQAMLADFTEPLANILPGFHDIDFRWDQWWRAVGRDEMGRLERVQEEVSFVNLNDDMSKEFWSLVKSGAIPRRVTHNDTKINNILFDHDGNVQCVIDLDTVMSATALNDFGDAIRSYCNTGLEDDPNPENVRLSLEMFEAYARGYLSEMGKVLTEKELEWLAFSPMYITYEQVMRFLMDYLWGDTYYKIKYPDHNLVRTRAQIALYHDMEAKLPRMRQIIKEIMNNQ